MTGALFTVLSKELRDAIRDRRTTIMILLTSVLAGPVMMVLMAQFISGMEEKASSPKVRMVGQENAPALVNFLRRGDVEIEEAPPDYEARIKEGRLDAVIVVPKDFDAKFLAGDGAKLEIVYDDSRTESNLAIRQAERLLRAFNRETGMLRLVARGVSPDLTEPVKVQHVNTATPRQKGAMLVTFIFPMFAIMLPLLGGMTIAIDSTAGERERGSLEPLLLNPVAVGQVVLGKWLAALTFATAVSALALGGFVFAPLFYTSKGLAGLMTFGTPEWVLYMVMVIPYAAMTASIQMLICIYGRSYREAQTYVAYLSTALTFVPIAVLFSGMRDAFWQQWVPVLGQQMFYMRVVRGDAVAASAWLIPSVVALVIAAVCITLVARLLRDERIVFGRN